MDGGRLFTGSMFVKAWLVFTITNQPPTPLTLSLYSDNNGDNDGQDLTHRIFKFQQSISFYLGIEYFTWGFNKSLIYVHLTATHWQLVPIHLVRKWMPILSAQIARMKTKIEVRIWVCPRQPQVKQSRAVKGGFYYHVTWTGELDDDTIISMFFFFHSCFCWCVIHISPREYQPIFIIGIDFECVCSYVYPDQTTLIKRGRHIWWLDWSEQRRVGLVPISVLWRFLVLFIHSWNNVCCFSIRTHLTYLYKIPTTCSWDINCKLV